MSTTHGRIPSSQTTILDDEPSQKVAAMLSKLDALDVAIKVITAQLDDDAGVTDEDYASNATDNLTLLDLEG